MRKAFQANQKNIAPMISSTWPGYRHFPVMCYESTAFNSQLCVFDGNVFIGDPPVLAILDGILNRLHCTYNH